MLPLGMRYGPAACEGENDHGLEAKMLITRETCLRSLPSLTLCHTQAAFSFGNVISWSTTVTHCVLAPSEKEFYGGTRTLASMLTHFGAAFHEGT